TSDPSDGADGLGRSFTATVEYSSESGESGIDSDASSISLDGGEGSVDNVEWQDSYVTADVSGLSYDESYTISGEIVDNVGHSDSFSIDFDTAELTQDSLQVSSLPGKVTVNPGEEKDFTFNVENVGGAEQTGVDVNFTVPEINSTVQDTGFSVEADSSEEVTVTLEPGDSVETGIYQGEISAKSDQGIPASGSVDIEVLNQGVSLKVVDRTREVSVAQGNSTTVSFQIENDGEETAQLNMTFTVAGNAVKLDPSTVTLGSRSTQNIEAVVAPSNTTAVGVYSGVLTIQYDNSTMNATVEVKVQPSNQEKRSEIARSIAQYENRFQDMKKELNRTEEASVQALISQANAALSQKDYATAVELRSDIEKKLSTDGGLPLVPIGIGVVVIVIVALLVYMLLPEREEEENTERSSYQSPVSRLGSVRPSKEERYSYENESALHSLRRKLRNSWEDLRESI
ncbi:MAG: hypothetical protein SVQ76_01000, partial [Candidatus Nanohaloarchaea archaeon]|nr:hypothetical protein [Candidatus Nanohaloarchaea archaeon]